MKSNNISRNLPKVTNTGNGLLNAWLGAAEEIIKDLRQRLAVLEKQRIQSSSTSETVIKLPSLSDYERLDNKISSITSDITPSQYPSAVAVKNYVDRTVHEISEQSIFEEWDIVNIPFADLGAQNNDKFKIVGNGMHDTIELRNGDIIEVYDDEDEDLKLLVIVDSRNIMQGVHTTDVLDEGVNHLYFTILRVLETVLDELVESDDEIVETDSILVALGKAKGRINQLFDSLESINSSIDTIETQISDLGTALSDKLNTDDLMTALQATVPATTGTYILKCVDGVSLWELQP